MPLFVVFYLPSIVNCPCLLFVIDCLLSFVSGHMSTVVVVFVVGVVAYWPRRKRRKILGIGRYPMGPTKNSK